MTSKFQKKISEILSQKPQTSTPKQQVAKGKYPKYKNSILGSILRIAGIFTMLLGIIAFINLPLYGKAGNLNFVNIAFLSVFSWIAVFLFGVAELLGHISKTAYFAEKISFQLNSSTDNTDNGKA